MLLALQASAQPWGLLDNNGSLRTMAFGDGSVDWMLGLWAIALLVNR
jgi:hypothetical protein